MMELKTNGVVETKDGREFTRLLGGFGEDKPMFTVWQAGELLGLRTSKIIENFNNNKGNFENGLDFIDLKSADHDMDSGTNSEALAFLKDNGYSQNKLNATKRWLAFSFSGVMKLIKIATTKESWVIYENFLEDYFKTKFQNKMYEQTIEEQLEDMRDQRALMLGKMFMAGSDEAKKKELYFDSETLNTKILELEKKLNSIKTLDSVKSELAIADSFTKSANTWDIGLVSKILNIKNMGRNNFFNWMRNENILIQNSTTPYQSYMKYFEVKPVVNKYNGFINNKTLLTSKGIKFIMDRLVKDGKVISKTYEQVLEELNGEQN